MGNKMTLNEKLDFISALEADGYNQDVIEGLVESIENPEGSVYKTYACASDMLDDILGDEDDESEQLFIKEGLSRTIVVTNNFKKDLKDMRSNKAFNSKLLDDQIETLRNGGQLDANKRDHQMSRESRPEYKGLSNFHHKSDIVVLYRLTDTEIILERIGNHAKLKLTRNKN